jgi:hypothetical protein
VPRDRIGPDHERALHAERERVASVLYGRLQAVPTLVNALRPQTRPRPAPAGNRRVSMSKQTAAPEKPRKPATSHWWDSLGVIGDLIGKILGSN